MVIVEKSFTVFMLVLFFRLLKEIMFFFIENTTK